MTWNVGQFFSDQGITNIASHACFELEIRGLDASLLETTGSTIEDSFRQHAAMFPELKTVMERTSQRPAGMTAEGHPLLKTIEQVHRELRLDVRYCVTSTNANWLMHEGIAAACIGMAQGKDGHTRQESIELSVMPTGMAKLDRLFGRLAYGS